MANYNFTIRATDSAGAFADQPFSINVQRTRLDRFVALGYNPTPTLFRSPDGVKWTAEASPITSDQYDGLVWSNDRWIAAPVSFSLFGTPVLTSVDLINWKSLVLNLSKGTYTQVPQPTVIRYRSGKWFCYASAPKAGGFYDILEFTSDDFVTWTQISIVYTTTTVSAVMRATDFQYDAASDTTVVSIYGNAFFGTMTRAGTGAWVPTNLSPATCPLQSLQLLNGLWVYVSQRNIVYMSRNGLDWFSRSFPAPINGVSYTNGKLVAACTSSYLYTSVDAGLTWTANATPISVGLNNRRVIASYGGQIVVTTGTSVLAISANAGATFTSTTFSGYSTVTGVYSRV